MKRRPLGWRKDLPDFRDYTYSSHRLGEQLKVLPNRVDLRSSFPAAYDQLDLGSCTANAVGAICDYKYGPDTAFFPSRLFLYYNTRFIEHTASSDSGATIRDTIKAVNTSGICEEYFWPYQPDKFAAHPTAEAYKDGSKHQALKYRRIRQHLDDLRCALSEDCPIAFGFSMFESFYDITKENYCMKLPGGHEEMLGGHAVVAVGYDCSLSCFIIRNSWGPEFGNEGYFLMPYSYILNPHLAADFWTIELMEK